MKAAVYYRVSTDKQDLLSQQHAVREWLATKQVESCVEIEDEGWSGTDHTRPGYQTLLALARTGEIDTVVVYRLDRFSRDATAAIREILELDQHGVGFVSVTQPILQLGHENPFRRTFLAMFADLAELERETIVARVRAGLAAARARGVKLGRDPSVTSEQAHTMRSLAGQGLSLREISRRVGFSHTTVKRVLAQTA